MSGSSAKKVIVVFGATGAQGGGVVKYLAANDDFAIRAITRSVDSNKAVALIADGHQVVSADLNKPETLPAAFEGAYGAFVVTSFWDPTSVSGENSEKAQAQRAISAAKAAGVQHFIWSTLPNSKKITEGKLEVKHFSDKAEVDDDVIAAGFKYYSFVYPPFYYQNLGTMMVPYPQEDGSKAWMFPISQSAKVVNAGDITEMGAVVAAAFAKPELSGSGARLAVGHKAISFGQMVETLNEQGHNFEWIQVPGDEKWDAMFSGALEFREMFDYWVMAGSYYGGKEAEAAYFEATEKLLPDFKFKTFAEWAEYNMPVEE
uniref:NmrA-like domain-containing protein n=1 Tax=Attheya septentrionalis TaxID=420275 RepID=A0A7S2XRE1_9STRA|mmetsp:Transcript_29783/g.54537  ORF Transcript_29783/g.54537 Transcript_29783/m.54537 type:complete len:317 (+) Transcript_29783:149-1099(+)